MLRDVRFIGLVEEDLGKVRKRFVHKVIVLESFSKLGRRSKVPQRRNLSLQQMISNINQIVIVKQQNCGSPFQKHRPFFEFPNSRVLAYLSDGTAYPAS